MAGKFCAADGREAGCEIRQLASTLQLRSGRLARSAASGAQERLTPLGGSLTRGAAKANPYLKRRAKPTKKARRGCLLRRRPAGPWVRKDSISYLQVDSTRK